MTRHKHTLTLCLLAAAVCSPTAAVADPLPWGFDGVMAWVDCDTTPGHEGSSIEPSHITKSCSSIEASAVATATPISLHAKITTNPGAPATEFINSYLAGSGIFDTALVTPDDPALLGTLGNLHFTATLDGSLQGNTSLLFGATAFTAIPDSPGGWNAYTLEHFVDFQDGAGPIYYERWFRYFHNSSSTKLIDVLISWDLPIVFGDVNTSHYRIDLMLEAFTENSMADFSNSMKLQSVVAYDANGNLVPASIMSGSGVNLASLNPAPPPSGVPEPSTVLLLGLGLLGLVAARRRG